MPSKKGADYKHLLPFGSDSEDDDFDEKENLVINQTSVPEVSINDTKRSSPILRNGNGYTFSTPYKSSSRDSCCSPTTVAAVFALMLLSVGVGYIAGFFTPMSSLPWQHHNEHSPDLEQSVHKRTADWRTKLSDYGTESCIRLVDADGDGILDIIVGIAIGKDVSQMIVESSMAEFCKNLGMKEPCAGGVVALRGYDGKLLWKADAYSEVFGLNCHSVDVNQDGTPDCIATGRLGTLTAIDTTTGTVLWRDSSSYVNRGWNIYSVAIIPDMDGDKVKDIVISHGGDPTVLAENHVRKTGWLMMISGRTGLPIGTHLDLPEHKEVYISPVLHERRDGSQYILYGSGGETVGGLFLAISLPDFYRNVMGLPKGTLVRNTRGAYDQWGFKTPSEKGEIELFRSDQKGVMVPPVLVDVNKDGVNDILMTGFDGTMVLYDGENLEVMWKIKFEDRESYSSPAPGYFNDDDVIDFMMHWSKGAWPFYNATDDVVIDGKDGTVLWNMTSGRYDVSSDLTVRTSAHNRDIFLYKAQGRNGEDPQHTGAIHGATGVQRVINRRSLDDGTSVLEETVVDESNADLEGVLLDSSHFRAKRRGIDKNYVECESDQTVFLAELFALDRTTMKAPIKLWERGSEKFYYKLSGNDKKLIQESIKVHGVNRTLTENEVPWSRGKRESQKPFCIVEQPDERTTGAIGDVDGDGKLDLIVNLVSVGILRDQYANYVKMKFDTDIYKVNLEEALARQLYTPINVTIHQRMRNVMNENKITSLKFLPADKQTWGGYMGTTGDSAFHEV
ncbi:protein FAM234B-like [Mizuhopecten yessoensis]|uniref:FAM234A/B beta-propeller domain-containing protein n=1 Tax=Mizuhopecten yessoensis TaxID=6573 RepID=A0A210QGW2_MIZYE|nr:protein FAM234B-like [Mizuhopecten yessoensis]OWF47957.1 hypothetical protein KP79_PYT17964 [Mizuhopecten yessoensis]